ncbi:MAG: hypothetical protein ISP01_07165 [Methanobrevibacter arboriphilus]|uniref:Uncharacterized protein n=1 Tax=Methanobrevibacter arboriphilus TaxID=39441 RepID=A0A843AQZ3_METAZ|nr:hypothetical protein [Methanobrevibacter arboriphilus]MBF4469170.1 hypothetical protein [Methanobrevibacter arboriphilus]
MTAKVYFRGQEAYFDEDNNIWKFTSDDSPVNKYVNIVCPKCMKKMKEDEVDNCIGRLPGVKHACCGHGVKQGYIIFENGIKLTFEDLKVEK